MASEGGAPGFFAGVTIFGTGDQTSVFFDLSTSDSCAQAKKTEERKRQEANNFLLFMISFYR
jgi:hypothetical protein